MEILFVIGLVAVLAYAFYSNDLDDKKIGEYVSKRGGELVSKEREFFDGPSMLSKYVHAYKVVYHDKNGRLRNVLVRVSGYSGMKFIDDDFVHEDDKKYYQIKKTAKSEVSIATESAVKLTDRRYKTSRGILVIKQEYPNPNVGEEVFLFDEPAPNNKYKLGFMSHVIVRNGKVSEITMF